MRTTGEGNGTLLQYACLGNPMDRGAWWATVHGVTELAMTEWLSTHTHSWKSPGSARPSQPRLCVHLNTAFQRLGQYIHIPEAGRDPVPQTPYFLHWSFPIPSPFPKALESELRGLRSWQVPQCRLKRDTCPVDGGGAKDLGLLRASPVAER